MIKEKNFDYSSFIGGWYLSKELCDELLDYFYYNKKYWRAGGSGSIETKVDSSVKESMDLYVSFGNLDNIILEYRKNLSNLLQKYLQKYEQANKVHPFDVNSNYNFQHYEINQGFKAWHCENDGGFTKNRHLVFMTYLNDVSDGGTEFLYQEIKTKAEKGLTLIWPAGWTHTHRGIISSTKEKTIITGWFSFDK